MTLFDEHVVVLITGISASGKSTVAELLAQRFERGVHVRGDVFRKMVVSGRVEMSADASDEARRQLELRYRLAASVADSYFDAGFSAMVQDIVLGADLPAFVEQIRSRPLFVVVLTPRLDVVAQREAVPGKIAYGDGRVSAEHLDAVLRTETPRIGLWLDTSEQSPEETVAEIARRCDEARVARLNIASVPVSPYIKRLREVVGSDLILVPAVSTLVQDERGRVLLVYEIDGDAWSTPGGSIDVDEVPEDAAEREVLEETGLAVVLDGIVTVLGGPDAALATRTATRSCTS